MGSTEDEQMSIAIIGAGIAGVTLAIALSKQRGPETLKITLYESRGKFSEIGAGVGFAPNAMQAMALIAPELADAFDSIKTPNAWPSKQDIWFDVRSAEGGQDLVDEIYGGAGFAHGGASRAEFLDNIVKLLPGHVGREFGKKCVDVSETEGGKMRVLFGDGSEVEADAVVGCDGVRSACRLILLGEKEKNAKPVFTGKYAYRKVVSMEEAVAVAGEEVRNRTIFPGFGGHLLLYPIAKGKLLNIVAFRDAGGKPWTDHKWVIPASGEEALEDYKGWKYPAKAIVELIDRPEKWALFDHDPASTYAKGNFCITGDAAHATTPHSGAGAGMAVEDAYHLAGLFSSDIVKSAADIKYAFKAYDETRRALSQGVVKRSRMNGMRLDMHQDDGTPIDIEEIKIQLTENMGWIWEVDHVAALEEAKALARSYKVTNGV